MPLPADAPLMHPTEMVEARRALGARWRLGRDVTRGEMGHLLLLRPASAWDTVSKWEEGRTPITGPVAVAVRMMLGGADPHTKAEALKPTNAHTSPRGPA